MGPEAALAPRWMASEAALKAVSIGIWTFVVASCPFFFAGAIAIFLLTVLWDRRRVVLHLYSCFWASTYLYLSPFWHVRIAGRDRLPWRGPAVLVANHASLIDILVLFALYRPYKWVSKKQNFKLPFIGWNMTLNGYVPLVRGDRDSIVAMMERCRKLLRRRTPVLIFPEGTRTQTGALQPFKDGAFRLAHEVGCPVIPIAVRGTGAALPKHGFVLRQRMNADVQVLPPLQPADYASAEALRDATRAAIEQALR
ncbi:MAG: lysophospholipid acyltransferase family protein [Myxococcales bacterium]